ncbi:hypothetical protein JHK87_015907 [Glycine soja]|nr:hypothetical protein JHK87_015907 [Glycine soja]
MSEDGCSVAKECSEEDDSSDEDYASIQRPAFMVDGEPNFDFGPPNCSSRKNSKDGPASSKQPESSRTPLGLHIEYLECEADKKPS